MKNWIGPERALGAYAVQQPVAVQFWIEREGQDFFLSAYDPSNKVWGSYREPMQQVTPDQLTGLSIQTDARSCALTAEGATIVSTY
jgi:hypothetical protein